MFVIPFLFAISLATFSTAHPSHSPSSSNADYHLLSGSLPLRQFPMSHSDALKLGIEQDGDYFGLRTFASLPPVRCWTKDRDVDFDVAIIGAPFDTSTSFRPGARFGPNGIRQGSARTGAQWAWNTELKVNPYQSLRIIDCGDVPMTYFDNNIALDALTTAYTDLIQRSVSSDSLKDGESIALDGKHHPRIITMGGDHSILLPILRGVNSVYGPISVIHFDSHMDTWSPVVADTKYAQMNHGTMLWHAANEGLVNNGTSIHAGLRSPLRGPEDYDIDSQAGFLRVEAWEIDYIGTKGVVDRIKEAVGNRPCYLSIDIDVIDPAFAPATGTPEAGGWTTREMKQIIHGMKDLKIVGADIVEVAPAYDSQAEQTVIAAAKMINEIASIFALTKLHK